MRYTVKNASPTGKLDETYGTEYLVNFNEDERTVRMSRRNPVQPGAEFIGEIINNPKYGVYFKSTPKTSNQNQNQQQLKPIKQKNENSFYVAYAKDLMVAYLDSLSWDWDKYDETKFNNAIAAVAQGAKDLMETLDAPSITTEDVTQSWTEGL